MLGVAWAWRLKCRFSKRLNASQISGSLMFQNSEILVVACRKIMLKTNKGPGLRGNPNSELIDSRTTFQPFHTCYLQCRGPYYTERRCIRYAVLYFIFFIAACVKRFFPIGNKKRQYLCEEIFLFYKKMPNSTAILPLNFQYQRQ